MTGRRVRSVLGLLLALVVAACDAVENGSHLVVVPGGNPERGADLIATYGCGNCHTIPGIHDARGLIGPPLTAWSRRSFIAGELANTPDNLVRWIENQQAVEPGTAMPNLGIPAPSARDVAAYLYTIH